MKIIVGERQVGKTHFMINSFLEKYIKDGLGSKNVLLLSYKHDTASMIKRAIENVASSNSIDISELHIETFYQSGRAYDYVLIDNIKLLTIGSYNLGYMDMEDIFIDVDNNEVFVIEREIDSGVKNGNVKYIDNNFLSKKNISTIESICSNIKNLDTNKKYSEDNSFEKLQNIIKLNNEIPFIYNYLHFSDENDNNSLYFEGMGYLKDEKDYSILYHILTQLIGSSDLQTEELNIEGAFRSIVNHKRKYDAIKSLRKCI